MATLFLARHGESDFGGTPERYCGWSDPPLNERGLAQAERLAERLRGEKIAAAFASDLVRAVTTAEVIAAAHRVEVLRLPALREQNYGEWEGLTTSEIHARWPEVVAARDRRPGSVAPAGGESYQEVLARAWPAFVELLERAQREEVVIVAHRGVNRALLAHVLEAPLDAARRIHQSPACVNLIAVSTDRVQVCGINDCGHL